MDTHPTIQNSRPDKTHYFPHRDAADSDLEELRHRPHHNAPRSTTLRRSRTFHQPRGPHPPRTSPRSDAGWPTRTATGQPRPPRELPKASSKGCAPTEPRTVATERAQYGHPTVPALDLTASIPRPAAGRPARPRRTSPPPPVRSNSDPPQR